jgi:spore coat protein A
MASISRRRFIQSSLIAVPWVGGAWPATASIAARHAKYVQPLPRPGAGIAIATPSAANSYAFTLREIHRQLHPQLPPTPIWAYDDGTGLGAQAGSFGLVVSARSGTPISMTFRHARPATYPERLPVDERFTPLGRQVRTLTHLHGGFVAGGSDGNPAITPQGYGPGETQLITCTNEAAHMPASMLWFHDHALGATRLNVIAGLAAGYVLRDAYDTGGEPNPIGIPGGAYEIPLVLQDRLFDADGSILYPRSAIAGSTWIGEYFGNVMLVNGKVWPYLDVEPRMYRLRVLNGCNARILNLDIGGLDFWQIGAEGGLFDVPISVRQLLLAPAERADLLVDFSRFAGASLLMHNHRPRRPASNPAPALESVMQIRVGRTITHPGPTTIPATLPGRKADLRSPVATRFITLNEVEPEEASWGLNLSAAPFHAPPTETPRAGSVEDWVYINLTGDTHPMHPHLVTFQVIGRTPFDAEAFEWTYGTWQGAPGGIDPGAFATGPMQPPEPWERGFKDTVQAHPGQYTTIRAKFDLPAGVSAPQSYVHHCHILEHEDNEMMRPFVVVP